MLPPPPFLVVLVDPDDRYDMWDYKQLVKLLLAHPETLPDLVEAGSASLDAYGGFIGECVALADSVPPEPAPPKTQIWPRPTAG